MATKMTTGPDIDMMRPHFDAAFYLATYPDIAAGKLDPLLHYHSHGWRELRDPSPDFSTAHYLATYPDIAEAGINPFLHYVTHGVHEGRSPRPAPLPPEIDALRPHLDTAYYLATYPDIAAGGLDPVLHYHSHGWRELRDPSPDFSTAHYLATNPDIAEAGINPFLHYVTHGIHEGRSPRPAPPPPEVEAMRAHFDSAFYLATYPDIAAGSVDPVAHYHAHGWRELRDPSPDFSTAYYLASNPDVAAAGINPFWHYLTEGRQSGRRSVPPASAVIDTLAALVPLEDRVRLYRRHDRPEPLLTATDLCRAILATGRPDLMVSVSHDDPRNIGGIQVNVRRETLLAADHGRCYLHLNPWQPLPRLAHDDDPDPLVTVTLDDATLGVCPTSTVTAAITQARPHLHQTHAVIHHLMGHSPERIAELVTAATGGTCLLWTHDFFTLSPSYALQRNDVAFCGAPAPQSNACQLCVYGAERPAHLARISAFFRRLTIDVVAPSQVTADLWLSRSTLPHRSLTVVPLLTLDWQPRAAPLPPETSDRITIGYLGIAAPLKGWPLFEQLVRRHRASGRFRFVHISTHHHPLPGADLIDLRVTGDHPDLATRALQREGVDIVLNWSSAFETFSLSTCEALAAGAFVLTRDGAGNVARLVQDTGLGHVLPDPDALFAFFDSDDIAELAARARTHRAAHDCALRRSPLSHAVLAAPALSTRVVA
jgi:hypothetical protein